MGCPAGSLFSCEYTVAGAPWECPCAQPLSSVRFASHPPRGRQSDQKLNDASDAPRLLFEERSPAVFSPSPPAPAAAGLLAAGTRQGLADGPAERHSHRGPAPAIIPRTRSGRSGIWRSLILGIWLAAPCVRTKAFDPCSPRLSGALSNPHPFRRPRTH